MEKVFSLRVGPAVFVQEDGYFVEVLPAEVASAMHLTSVRGLHTHVEWARNQKPIKDITVSRVLGLVAV